MFDIQKLIADIESVILRAEIVLLDARLREIELYQQGTKILESILGRQIQ